MTLVYNRDMDGKRIYSVKEMARQLEVNPRTILREIERGKLKPKKVGRKFVFWEEDIQKYLSQTGDVGDKISEFCRSRKHEMVALLQKLVAVPSESETGGEENVAIFIKGEMDKLGIGAMVYGKGGAATVQASFGYADSGILLDCPIDATPAGDINKWSYPPYGGVVKGGKMYGRGTADCKAGMVAMIYAVQALKELGVDRDKLRVELVFDGGEQNGAYLGMKGVVKRGLPVEAGIIGYAGDSKRLAIGARGYHRFDFVCHGQAVHTGSGSRMGVNSISNMAKFILEMEKEELPDKGGKYFPFGCRMTFSQISGGRAINIVPDECTAKLDVRVVPGVNKAWVEKMISSVVYRMRKSDPAFVMEWVRQDLGHEGYVLDEEEKIVRVVQASVGKVLGQEPELVANGPSHIGNMLFEQNIPVLVWGPVGANVHSYDEFVEIDSVPKTAEIYAQIILEYFGNGA